MNSKWIKIAVTMLDGTLKLVLWITDNNAGIKREYSEAGVQASLDKYAWASQIASWRVVPESFHLPDRTFRNAWRDDGKKKAAVDMVHAREIHKDHLRHCREPVLTALDVEYQRADEAGDAAAKAAVAQRKQALRDITAHPGITAAKTPDALKAIWPEELGSPDQWR